MKKILSIAVLASALTAQLFLLGTTTLAQTYDEDTYGSGVYNGSRTDPNQPSNPDETPASNQNYANTDPDTNATNGDENDGSSSSSEDSENTRDNSNTSDPDDLSPIEQDGNESDGSLLRWVSLSALGAALLLIVVAFLARKRRQNRE